MLSILLNELPIILDNHMANTDKNGVTTSGVSGQEAEELVSEIGVLKLTMRMGRVEEDVIGLEMFRRSSLQLRKFLARNCSEVVNWEEVENALRICAESYRKERKIVEMEQSIREEALIRVKESELRREEIRRISSEVLRERGAWTGGYDMRKRFGNGNYVRFQGRCNGCGIWGHKLRDCRSAGDKINKGNFSYESFQGVCHRGGVLGHSIRFCPKSDRRVIKSELPHRDVRVYNLFLKEQDTKE